MSNLLRALVRETPDEITLNEVQNLAKFGLDVVALARLRHQKPFSFRPKQVVRKVEEEKEDEGEDEDDSKPKDVGTELEEVPAAEAGASGDLDTAAAALNPAADDDTEMAPVAALDPATPGLAPAGALGATAAEPLPPPLPLRTAFEPTPAFYTSAAAPESTLIAPLPGIFEDWPEGYILLDGGHKYARSAYGCGCLSNMERWVVGEGEEE
ncbi:hypothetical protein FPQ18DRAFT_391553 [Pyronema domesticum]|nr:hypothetical protein FPQ18DRAFT_391553 [Pyronema domesticum]